jgi:hypothetical protein
MFTFIKTVESIAAELEAKIKDLEALEAQHLLAVMNHAKVIAATQEAQIAAGAKAALANSLASKIRSMLGLS